MNCKWLDGFSGICVNADSPRRADFCLQSPCRFEEFGDSETEHKTTAKGGKQNEHES